MAEKAVGVLHPGAMGVTVGTSIEAGGHRVVWASEGRSEATRGRATAAGLPDQFHLGAAALYELLLEFKDQTGSVQFEHVLAALAGSPRGE